MKSERGRKAGFLAAMVLLGACGGGDAEEEMAGAAGDTTAAVAPAGMPDAEMQAVLDQLQALGAPPIEILTPAEARQQPTPADAVKRLLEAEGEPTTPEPVPQVADRTIPGAAGPLPARVYSPAGGGPYPVLVYYHGGGWVIADKDVYDASARALANQCACVVLSVDYRQGPENPFPAAHDDAFAAYRWALANAASLNGDPAKVAVAGESAGGGLALSTAMMARDQGVPMPLHVLAIYPIAGTDTTTASYMEHAAAKPLNRPMMSWFFQHYLKGEADRADPRVNIVAADLQGLPPTTILNAQIDPLRSEGELLAERLRAAGVTVDQRTWEGVTHEFFGMGAVHPKAKEAQGVAGQALQEAFGR